MVVSATPDEMVIRAVDQTISVVPEPGATLYSGASGVVSSMTAFRIGDRVGAQGTRIANRLVATKIRSIFTPIYAKIERVSADGAIADTSEGPLLLSAGQLPQHNRAYGARRAQEVKPGTVLHGLGWTDPSTGERYLLVRG
jgi:hypothetical protein